MMDLSQRGSGSEEMNNKSMRSCTDCQTTKTPLWRGGPAGPKSLCNACGIRQRKKRRAILGIKKGMMVTEKKERSSSSGNSKNGGVSLKVRFHTLGREVLLQRSLMEKQRNLGEEEQAAVLLMALSCGAVCV